MNDILSKYIEIALEIILFSLLITVVSVFGGLAKDSVNLHNEQRVIQREIQEYREFSTYINKGKVVDGNLVDNLVSGDDVVRFIGLFRHDVAIDIDLGATTIMLEKYKEEADGTSKWDIEYISDELDMHRVSMFKIEAEIDEFSDEVQKVIFTKQ